jgi:hypothetical protein
MAPHGETPVPPRSSAFDETRRELEAWEAPRGEMRALSERPRQQGPQQQAVVSLPPGATRVATRSAPPLPTPLLEAWGEVVAQPPMVHTMVLHMSAAELAFVRERLKWQQPSP